MWLGSWVRLRPIKHSSCIRIVIALSSVSCLRGRCKSSAVEGLFMRFAGVLSIPHWRSINSRFINIVSGYSRPHNHSLSPSRFLRTCNTVVIPAASSNSDRKAIPESTESSQKMENGPPKSESQQELINLNPDVNKVQLLVRSDPSGNYFSMFCSQASFVVIVFDSVVFLPLLNPIPVFYRTCEFVFASS